MRLVPHLPVMKDLAMIAEDQVTHFVNDADNPRVIVIRNPERHGAPPNKTLLLLANGFMAKRGLRKARASS